MDSACEELLALAEKELLGPQEKEPSRFDGSSSELSEAATAARKLRKRAIALLPRAASLLGLVPSSMVSSTSTTATTAAATPAAAWPRRETPVLPASATQASSASKVPRVVRNQVLMRLAAEHALLLAAAAPLTSTTSDEKNDVGEGDGDEKRHLTSLLLSTVASSASIRRSATSLAMRQEEGTLYRVATGKETYLALARKATALSAKRSAAEVLLLREKEEEEKRKKSLSSSSAAHPRAPAPAPNPKPLPLPRKEPLPPEKTKKEEEKEKKLEIVEVDFDDDVPAPSASAPKQQRQRQQPPPPSSLSEPRSAILEIVSVALRPLLDEHKVSPEVAAAASERALAKVLAAFEESTRAREKKGEKKERWRDATAAVSAFLTDSQRAKISQFARDCVEAEDARARARARKRQRQE